MKHFFSPLLFLFACTLCANAGFELSRDVYKLDELEIAKAEAKERGKPIAIFYSDKDTTCGLCANVSEVFIDEFDSRTVMIYVDNSNYKELPSAARKNLNKDKCGKYIPWLVLMDAELEETLITTGYSSYKEDNKDMIKAVKRAIRDYKK